MSNPNDPLPNRPKFLDLSLPQVVGGALAAMTAAALGWRMGVAGTVIGAAVASVTATLAGALYTGSLRRTHAGARTLWGRVHPKDSVDHGPALESPPVRVVARPSRRRGSRSRVHPLGVLVGAAAALALATVGVTGVELVGGHSLSGGTGTTFQEASTGHWAPRTSQHHDPARQPAATDSTPSAEPSDPPSDPSGSSTPTDPGRTPSQQPGSSTTPAVPPTKPAGGSSAAPSASSPAPSGQPSAAPTQGADRVQSLTGLQR